MGAKNIPSIKAPRPSSIPNPEWLQLEELYNLARKGYLVSGSEEENTFEWLVDTINREVRAGKATPSPEQNELLNAALKEWHYIRSRRLID